MSTSNTSIDTRLQTILEQHGGGKLLSLLDEQQQCLKDHQARVARMASIVAKEMGLSEAQEEAIYVAASMHDIGIQQFSFSPSISKDNQLAMMERFKKHPEIGADLVKDISLSIPVDQIILQHHERMDGSGFPNKLKKIMIEAQVIAVVDILDGVYSIHASKPDIALNHCCDEIYEMRHGLLDPMIIDLTILLAKGYKLPLSR